jgi:hypothetical protein
LARPPAAAHGRRYRRPQPVRRPAGPLAHRGRPPLGVRKAVRPDQGRMCLPAAPDDEGSPDLPSEITATTRALVADSNHSLSSAERRAIDDKIALVFTLVRTLRAQPLLLPFTPAIAVQSLRMGLRKRAGRRRRRRARRVICRSAPASLVATAHTSAPGICVLRITFITSRSPRASERLSGGDDAYLIYTVCTRGNRKYSE